MQAKRRTAGLVVVVGAVALVVVGAAAPAAAQRRGADAHVYSFGQESGSRIGVQIEDLADNDPADEGAMVSDVQADSPAASAGVATGDVVVEFDGERVRSARQLTRLVQETPAGRTVGATVLRDGDRVALEITPEPGGGPFGLVAGRLPELAGRVVTPDGGGDSAWMLGLAGGPRLGADVQELSSQLADYFGVDDGVLVTGVEDGSVAAEAGLRAGDVITAVDGRSIDDIPTLRRRLAAVDAGESVSLGVTRSGRELEVTPTLENAGSRTRGLPQFFGRQGI